MVPGAGAVRRRAAAVVDVVHNRDLLLLQIGWGMFFLVDWTSLVAVSVWAYRHSGTDAVALVGLARLLPGAIALPFGAWAADRFPRRNLVVIVDAALTVIFAALAIAVRTGSPAGVIYTLIGIASVAAAPFRPAQLALVPLLARSSRELVGANVAAGMLEGLATFAGPALAGLLLLATGPWMVLGLSSLSAAGGLIAISTITVTVDPSKAEGTDHVRPKEALLGGLTELRHDHDVALIVVGFVCQVLVRGFLTVLLVSISFKLLHLGNSGVGWLSATMGIGGIIGSVCAVTLTGRRKLGRPFAFALVLWGLPIAVIGLAPSRFLTLAVLAVVGLANSLLDVSGFTLLQRLGNDRALGRVFGVLYTFGIAAAGLGSLLVPVLVSALGLRPVLLIVGSILPLFALVSLRWIDRIDANSQPPSELLRVMEAIPLLAPLPPTMLEKLARHANTITVAAGTTIVTEGEAGDLFYALIDGEAVVTQHGAPRRTLQRGDHFGEIALLHDGMRTATITATEPGRLLTLSRQDFLESVSGSEPAFSVATQEVEQLLDGDDLDAARRPND